MPLDDVGDANAEMRRMQKALKRTPPQTVSGGDSDHLGDGTNSLQIGLAADAQGHSSVALGRTAWAYGDYSVSLGTSSFVGEEDGISIGDASSVAAERGIALGVEAFVGVGHDDSAAIGSYAVTTAANQIMLGTSAETVVVPGTFSNPSARKLKCNITPAPVMVSVFPTLYEWEYIAAPGRRRVGPMADDLIGTDAERFLVRDDDGEPAGIDKLGLHTAQIAVLLADLTEARTELAAMRVELTELKNKMGA